MMAQAKSQGRLTGYLGEDFPVKGKPVLTVLRGNVIMENGEVTAEAGSGRLLRGRPDGNGAR